MARSTQIGEIIRVPALVISMQMACSPSAHHVGPKAWRAAARRYAVPTINTNLPDRPCRARTNVELRRAVTRSVPIARWDLIAWKWITLIPGAVHLALIIVDRCLWTGEAVKRAYTAGGRDDAGRFDCHTRGAASRYRAAASWGADCHTRCAVKRC
jgi:hypothetical protein